MIGKELRGMINKGIIPTVEFTKEIEDLECRFEKGMRSYVTNVSMVDKEGCVEVTFEEKDFSDYNKSIEKPDWYNEDTNKYDLKYSETKMASGYKGVVSFWEMEDDEIYNFVLIEDDSLKLFKEYQDNNCEFSYVKWLEQELLKSRESK
jgi:hypothetical protein